MIFGTKTIKKTVTVSLFLILLVGFIGYASAITGSIGNARMVIHSKTGEQVEKYILVKNVNDVPVNILIEKDGNLSRYIRLKETNFSLAAGEEKKVEFVIGIADVGTTEGKLNIKFSAVGQKNGVGLSSNIIVVAEEGTVLEWEEDTETSLLEDVVDNSIKDSNGNYNMIMIAALITVVLALVLLILMFILKKRKKKKSEKEVEIKSKRKVKTSE